MRILAGILAYLFVVACPAHAQVGNLNEASSETEMAGSMLYPTVQIQLKNKIGSGTIIFSDYLENTLICDVEEKIINNGKGCDAAQREGRQMRTYAITNWHVVMPMPAQHFKPAPQSPKKTAEETDAQAADANRIRVVIHMTGSSAALDPVLLEFKGVVIARDEEDDLAMIRIDEAPLISYVAHIAPIGVPLQPFRKVWALGSPLGYGPIPTEGLLSGERELVGNKIFLLSSAQVYAGSSGGGLYHHSKERNRFELIGVTVAMAIGPFGPVPHMALSVPLPNVYTFLNVNKFDFIIKKNLQ